MGLLDRLRSLLGNKFNEVISKKVAVIGQLDELSYYTLITLISSGFGFSTPITFLNVEIFGEASIVLNQFISNGEELTSFLSSKFPGSSVNIYSLYPQEVPSLISLVNPSLIINLSRSNEIAKLLKFDNVIDVLASDILYVGPPKEIYGLVRYKEQLHLQNLLASPIIAYEAVHLAMGEKVNQNIIAGNMIYMLDNIKPFRDNLLVIGAGAIGNWFLEVVSPYLEDGSKILILDFDLIEDHNVLRQPFYSVDDVGKKKSEVLSERLKEKFRLLNKSVEVSYIDGKVEKRSLDSLENEIRRFFGDKVNFCVFVDNNNARYYASKLYQRFRGNFLMSTVSPNLYSPSSFSFVYNNYSDLKASGKVYYSRKKRRASCIAPGSAVHPFSISGVFSLLSLYYNKEFVIKVPIVNIDGNYSLRPKYYVGMQQVYDAIHNFKIKVLKGEVLKLLEYITEERGYNKEDLRKTAIKILSAEKLDEINLVEREYSGDLIELAHKFLKVGIPPQDIVDVEMVNNIDLKITNGEKWIEELFYKIKGDEKERIKKIMYAFVSSNI